MTVYVDSSFLVSVYIKDRHCSATEELLRPGPEILVTPFHRAEWTHAIAQHVFRGIVAPTDAEKIYTQFEHDRVAGLWKQVAMPDNVFDLCVDLARQYGPKLGVRTLDSLHVACALELKAERFWTFDERQKKLAKARGMKTL